MNLTQRCIISLATVTTTSCCTVHLTQWSAKTFPYSQLLQLRCLCSTAEVFEYEKVRILDLFFRDRGYPEAVLKKAKSWVSHISREEALKKKGRPNHQRLVHTITYHLLAKDYRDIILNNYQKILQADNHLKNIFNKPPMIA